jgi:hypothetical protein
MATKSEKWIPFFIKGKAVDSKGNAHDITDARLTQVLDANKGRAVALAIGHPKGNAPAMGWVDDYKRVGDLLFAKVKALAPDFETDVKKGRWAKISASVTSGGLLNHIGFFGTQPTAMDGIPMVEFAAPEDATVIEFKAAEFADWRTASHMNTVGELFGRLREWLIEKSGMETADRVLSSYDVDRLKKMEADPEPVPARESAFSKPEGGVDMAKTVAELEAELALEKAKTAEFSRANEKTAQLEADLAAERRKNQSAEFSAFLDSEEMRRKVSPAIRQDLLPIMEFAASTETYEFSAPDPKDAAKTVNITKAPVDMVREFAKKYLPDVVDFSEFARKDNAGKRTSEEEEAVKGIAAASPKTAA